MKNLKISTKLTVAFTLIIIMSLMSMAFAIVNLNQSNSNFQKVQDRTIPSINYSWTVRRNMVAIERELYKAITATSDAAIKEAVDNSSVEAAAVMDALTKLRPIYEGNKADFEYLDGAMKDAATYRSQVAEHVLKNTPEGNARAFSILTTDYSPLFVKVNQKVVEMSDGIELRAVELGDEVNKSSLISLVVLLSLAAVSSMFAIIIGIAISRSITRPLKLVENATTELAKGNLSVKIDYNSKDEVGVMSKSLVDSMAIIKGYINQINGAMAAMAQGNFSVEAEEPFIGDFKDIENSIDDFTLTISDALSQISMASEQVSSGSEQVSSGSQALAQGATEQASSVEELSASIAEITNQIKENATNSTKAMEMANGATSAITHSNEQMQSLMSAMSEINQKSSEIGKIIKTIEDIAFQTNILALNAAVEAARAGAAGKGFAVVADEVRNLASKSAEAAKNTTELIESSIGAVENGTKIATETARDLMLIVSSAIDTSELIGKVTKASNDQAESIAQINQGVEQISSVVQTNSATSEESAAASEELSSQANLMKQLISQFKLKKLSK